jgi:signal transduction histidine kinase
VTTATPFSATPTLPRLPRRAARAWSTLWRMGLALIVGLGALLISYGTAFENVDPTGPESLEIGGRLLLDVVLGLSAVGLIPLRHRGPLVVAVVVLLLSVLSSLATGAAAIVLVSLATRRRWPEIAVGGVLFAAATVLFDLAVPMREESPLWQLVLIGIVISGILVVTGMYIGGRRQLLVSLQEQADGALREQQSQRDQARLSERARIAREMHDVLAHRLSLVALHAGVLESRPDLSAAQRASTVGIVRENAHLALGELRDVLGVLRDPAESDGQQQTQPQPTLAGLADLLEQSRLAGTPTTVAFDDAVAGRLEALTDSTSRHLYRFIQEGLTNARKHAPGQPVAVRLGGEPGDRVTLWMQNAVPAAASGTIGALETVGARSPSGLGLTGLGERARLAGGELTAAVAGGLFTVEAWLPWTR